MKWTKGRQGTGYFKMKLFESRKFHFDCYILRFPKGSKLITHVDKVNSDWEHHRFNFILKKAKVGGVFHAWFMPRKKRNARWYRFRPDIHPHGMTPIVEGSRYVLSIGWLRRKK